MLRKYKHDINVEILIMLMTPWAFLIHILKQDVA